VVYQNTPRLKDGIIKTIIEDDMEALVIVLFSLIGIFYLESFHLKLPSNLYRIVAIFKVETDIIANISASPIGRAGIFVIMSVEAFRAQHTKNHLQFDE
jgi:hypothetical protein